MMCGDVCVCVVCGVCVMMGDGVCGGCVEGVL